VGSNQPSDSAFRAKFFEGVCDDNLVLVDDLVAVEFPTVVEGDQSGNLGVASPGECRCAELNFGSSGYIPHHNSSFGFTGPVTPTAALRFSDYSFQFQYQ
jgi:hypothetical protein